MKKADAAASGKADRKMDRKTRYAIIFAASAAILSLALGALALTSAAIGSGDMLPRAGSEAPAVTSAADTSPETGNSIIGAVIAVIVVIAIILVIIALMPRRKNG